MDGILSVEAVLDRLTATSTVSPKHGDSVTLSEYWEYPLTYTNYVMVSQKNVTGLDAVPVVPEFVDYLKIKVD